MTDSVDIVDIEVMDEACDSGRGGFLAVRSMTLRNIRADGTSSAWYSCEWLERPKGLDAVVVALYHRGLGRTRVLLREGLRPALRFGRNQGVPAVPDARRYLRLTEVVAGIVERDDCGEVGLRNRAVAEVAEEAGYTVSSDDIEFLGAGTFASPGSMPEKYWLTAVEIADPDAGCVPAGDGSPFEEGARIHWVDLDVAIAAAVNGEIEDAKTELVLRRLRDRLGA